MNTCLPAWRDTFGAAAKDRFWFRLSVRGIICAGLLSLLLATGCSSNKDSALRPEAATGAPVAAVMEPSHGGSLSMTDFSEQSSRVGDTPMVNDAAFEDYDDEDNENIADPLEGWNRFWFGFNDVLLLKVIKPVYTGYTYVMPQEFRSGFSNFLYNLQMPVRFVNSLLQGRPSQAVVELGRFIVNTTVGMGGFIDVAKRNKPLIPVDPRGADFGQTLATWGVGEGIYLVWPVIGPSTVRDTVGTAGDIAAAPFFWAVEPIGPIDFWPGLAADAGLRFNDIGSVIDAYEAVTKGAVEPYIAARDAYVKYRRAGVLRGRVFSNRIFGPDY